MCGDRPNELKSRHVIAGMRLVVRIYMVDWKYVARAVETNEFRLFEPWS